MVTEWTQGNVQVGDLTVHYTRTSTGGKPQIVLAHGFSDNGMCWLPVAQNLAADYDVILPDARGHGRSSRVLPDEVLDLPADLAGFIQALKLDRPVVGGHSMGGSTAAGLGARFPGLARALILEDPAWRDAAPQEPAQTQKAPEPNPWYEWLVKTASQPVEEVMAHGRADNPTWPEVEMRPWAEAKQQFDPNFVTARSVRGRQPDWREVARAITVPTLLVTADPEKGAIVSAAVAKEAHEINPFIQVAHIPGVGHNIRREAFPAYVAAVRAFLAEV